MARAQHDPIPAATDVEDPEPSTPPASQRRRMLLSCAAVCLACLLAALALAGESRARSRPIELAGRVGLAEVSGEAYCESGAVSTEECERSTCCDWNPDGLGRCWSGVGRLTCHDMAAGWTLPEDDAILDSVKGCVMIEELQEQIDRAEGEAKAELEARLATLKQDIPDWEEITSAYSGTDAWRAIRDTARLEGLHQAAAEEEAQVFAELSKKLKKKHNLKDLEKLKNHEKIKPLANRSGTKKLDNLQKELKQAQAAVPSVDNVQKQASAVWQENVDKLPDLDDINANADKLAEDMQESVSGLVDTAPDSVKRWL